MVEKKKAKITEAERAGRHHTKRDILIVITFVLFCAASGLGVWFYSNHVLPNVTVGDVAIGQADRATIERAIEQQDHLSITFMNGDQRKTVPFSTVGVTVNVDTTIQNALAARRSGNLLDNLQFWRTVHVPLVFNNDWGLLKAYMQKEYPAIFVDATNAQLAYDASTHTFTILPGTDGKGFDSKTFETSLPDIALHPHNTVIELAPVAVQPLIQPKDLASPQAAINQRLQLGVNFTLDDKTVATASANDIASWTYFVPDVTKSTVSMEFDKAKIEQFLTDTVAPKVTTTPIDRKVIIDQLSGSQTIISSGRAGKEIKDTEQIADAVQTALQQNQQLSEPISLVDAPFKTVTLTGSGKWIEVDLSKETTTLYVGDTAVQSFLISSGKGGTPTELGTFHVYYKTPSQTMTGTIAGEYYYLPNVPWVSFFDGGEAFHGTYWHHNFGHPMSHGCINMTIADAKVLYDFAPVGTKVVVHD